MKNGVQKQSGADRLGPAAMMMIKARFKRVEKSCNLILTSKVEKSNSVQHNE